MDIVCPIIADRAELHVMAAPVSSAILHWGPDGAAGIGWTVQLRMRVCGRLEHAAKAPGGSSAPQALAKLMNREKAEIACALRKQLQAWSQVSRHPKQRRHALWFPWQRVDRPTKYLSKAEGSDIDTEGSFETNSSDDNPSFYLERALMGLSVAHSGCNSSTGPEMTDISPFHARAQRS
ncbi:hypothetical protein [Bradyrhizobium sp. CCBAU 11361]|uniref:hypothetical protein n=1 Tax=Bradyrhizobium sp. CCBAU 11361 TaxID=1630812 RepID=UPI0023025A60|nr:hypothetical protein [Bradyrhizobium sp. CCBAU 11361]